KENLKKMAYESNLSSSVVFVSSVPRDVLFKDFFMKFRVVVIPRPKLNNSIDFILPIKLIESLAAGKPTIAMDIPVMRDITGSPLVLVKSAHPLALANAMETLSSNKEMLSKY